MKELGSGTAYNTHNTTSMIRTLKHVSDILQTEEAFTVKEYTHTHTHTESAPLDGTHLDAVRGLIQTKRFCPSVSTKRAQLSIAATTVWSTDLFNIMSCPESMLIIQD